jgi:glutathione peroxidase-family protein
MTTKITVILLLCVSHFFAKAQAVPGNYLLTLNGDSAQLSQYQGKKILLIVLPVSHAAEDSAVLLNIESIYQQYKDSITFIGVPSYEDGYVDSLSTDIKAWYIDTLHLSFIITTGMYTRNSSGSQQSYLFQWLTTETMNGHFGTDITTHGQKFLLNQYGELKAVFDAGTALDERLMNFILE